MSDRKSARPILGALPAGATLMADRGYDSNWFWEVPTGKSITPCILPTKGRKVPLTYDKTLYRQRHKVENMFVELKDWRRIATRYDPVPTPAQLSVPQQSLPSVSINDNEPSFLKDIPMLCCIFNNEQGPTWLNTELMLLPIPSTGVTSRRIFHRFSESIRATK